VAGFAALDDSMYWTKDLTQYVYAHALVTPEDTFTIVFHGNKEDIYMHEENILEFILRNLSEGSILYSCPHYKSIYPSIEENIETLVYLQNGKSIPREAKRLFRKAHENAKSTAKSEFNKFLAEQESKKRELEKRIIQYAFIS